LQTSKTKSPPAPDPVPASSEIDARIKTLEFQAKYPGCTPEAREIIEANSTRDAKQAARMDDRHTEIIKETAKRETLIKDTVKELLETGNLKIMFDGKPVHTLNDQNVLICPDCGTPLNDTAILIHALSERWITSGGDPDVFVIRDARGPLNEITGTPSVYTRTICQACGTIHSVMMQLCMIV